VTRESNLNLTIVIGEIFTVAHELYGY